MNSESGPESNDGDDAQPIQATIQTLDGQEIATGMLTLEGPNARGLFQSSLIANLRPVESQKEVLAVTDGKIYRLSGIEPSGDWPPHFHFSRSVELTD